MYGFRFAHMVALSVLLPLIPFLIWLRHTFSKQVVYVHPVATMARVGGFESGNVHRKVLFVARLCTLAILALLAAMPQLVDHRSKVQIEGIDIVLALDASGSMQFQDYGDEEHSRFDIAKKEAIRFIDKRTNDAMGLVLFGNDAFSRSPLTSDRKMLREIVQETELGRQVDPDGTKLFAGMAAGVNRLKHSKSKSKIMILLTDGEPSRGDLDPQVVLKATKELGVKVYTIGIGSEEEDFIRHPFYGLIQKPRVNVDLLRLIAHETGGSFFMARNEKDMRTIYDTIDRLERTELEVPIFTRYYDIFAPFALVLLGWLSCEVLLLSSIWFGI